MTFVQLHDGVRLRCSITGSGPDVVLLHGWKQSHRLFDQAVQRLSASHRVIAFDQRGTGESDKPEGGYEFAELGADLREVLELCDATDATVVGWSMGCTVLLSSMNKPSTRIGRAILVNGPLRLIKNEEFPFAMSEEQLSLYVEALEAQWPLGTREFLAESLLPENVGMVPFLEYVAWQTPLHVALRLVRNQARIDHCSTIEALSIPVLAAYSEKDPYWPLGVATWIASRAPHGHLHVFSQSAHCPPLEEPEEFARVVHEFSLQDAA